MLAEDQAYIESGTDVEWLERATRAFYPWPIVWTIVNYNGKELRLKLFEVEVVSNSETADKPGRISVDNGHIYL